jgi:DnaJ-class molecular chaperone
VALTYYELLNVSLDASPSDIKSAYRALSKHYHSEGGELANDAIMRELTTAKDELLDPIARAEYDCDLAHPPNEQTRERDSGHAARQSSPASDGYSWGGRSAPPTPPPASPSPTAPRPYPKPTTPGYWSRRH